MSTEVHLTYQNSTQFQNVNQKTDRLRRLGDIIYRKKKKLIIMRRVASSFANGLRRVFVRPTEVNLMFFIRFGIC